MREDQQVKTALLIVENLNVFSQILALFVCCMPTQSRYSLNVGIARELWDRCCKKRILLGELGNKYVLLQARRSQRAFPHPHFDKQIPDQQEPQPRGSKNTGNNFLYLKRSFHESLRSDTGDTGDWERLAVCDSLTKLR